MIGRFNCVLARWDHQSWLSVTCAPLIRGTDGTWKRFGR